MHPKKIPKIEILDKVYDIGGDNGYARSISINNRLHLSFFRSTGYCFIVDRVNKITIMILDLYNDSYDIGDDRFQMNFDTEVVNITEILMPYLELEDFVG